MVSNETPIKVEKFFKLNLEMTRPQTAVLGSGIAGAVPDSPVSVSGETLPPPHRRIRYSPPVCDVYTTGSATAVGYEM